MSHILVIANETAASNQLLEAVRGEAAAGVDLVTVLAPVNAPSGGYVVYEDRRRAAAGRRLNRTLDALHEAGISAHGLVVDTSPVDAVKDALAQLEPPPVFNFDEIPQVVGGPYEYGVPGARHAVFNGRRAVELQEVGRR